MADPVVSPADREAEAEPRRGPLDTAAGGYLLSRTSGISPFEILAAGPRASRFLLRSATRGLRGGDRERPEIPTRIPTWSTAFGVWADELVLAFMATTRLSASDDDFARISDEVTDALAALEKAGALDDPRVLHPRPEAPTARIAPARYRGLRFEHLQFMSGYTPAVPLPGTTRWMSVTTNQTVHAYVLRHPTPRPWVVQLHGFGMGKESDVVALRARHLFSDLGVNVIQPVFPGHGPRAEVGGEDALTMDYLNNVHAVSQAISDVRQVISWIEATDPDAGPVAVHGVSMGGYLAALLAGLDERVGCVISGVPTVDLSWVMNRHLPEDDRVLADEYRLLGERAARIHSVVSPLALDPLVPHDRRFVYAGVADRMATPGEAYRLWVHWEQPSVLWYRGAHVAFAWSREVRSFIDRALRSSGYASVTRERAAS
ncbi:MAG: alpha/beta fold hydrolase [Acidimicrobiales bacterium]